MMEEIWKDVKGFEGRYQVSNLGRVRSLPTSYYRDYPHKKNVLVCYWPEKIQTIEHTGKVRLRTINGDIDVRFDVGHLVAQQFIEGYKDGMEVRHRDGNIMNNQVGNLHVFMPETIENEEWKDIKGFEGRYQISNMGRVRSMDRWTNDEHQKFLKGRLLNPSMNKGRGYLRVSLSDGNRNYTHYDVHRLVALHFVSGYKPGLVVNHKNEIKTDNRAENLEWCSSKYNANYGSRNKRSSLARSKAILQYNLNEEVIAEHSSLTSAGKSVNGNAQGVYMSANGIIKKYKGFIWKYK